MGIFSTTRRRAPRPKLLVTWRRTTPVRPQKEQASLGIDGNDNGPTRRTEFRDGARGGVRERVAADDELLLARDTVSLALDDLAREDDAFEVEDVKVVIIEFLRGVGGYDVPPQPNELAETLQGSRSTHGRFYPCAACLTLAARLPSADSAPSAQDREGGATPIHRAHRRGPCCSGVRS